MINLSEFDGINSRISVICINRNISDLEQVVHLLRDLHVKAGIGEGQHNLAHTALQLAQEIPGLLLCLELCNLQMYQGNQYISA